MGKTQSISFVKPLLCLMALMAMSVAVSGCGEAAQKLKLYKLGMVEEDWPRIRGNKRRPAAQPNRAALMQTAERERAVVAPVTFGDDLNVIDFYDTKIDPRRKGTDPMRTDPAPPPRPEAADTAASDEGEIAESEEAPADEETTETSATKTSKGTTYYDPF